MKEQGLVLAFAPTYAGKQYAVKEWHEGLLAQTYDPMHIYSIDNTFTGHQYYETLLAMGIEASHVQPWQDATMEKTFHRCWELGLERAEQLDAYWIFSVESDNVPAPEALQTMVDIALYGKIHLVTHDYPMHQDAVEASGMRGDEFYYTELGCMLMTRQLLTRALLIYEEFHNVPMSIFTACERYHGGHAKLTNAFEVKHLSDYRQEFSQFSPPKEGEDVGFCPTPKVPDDYGTIVPECLRADG
jgi:hypothetical protein